MIISLQNISKSLTEIIKDSELKKVSIDIIEAIIDTETTEGIVKDIPILNSILSLYNGANNITDKLFIKKIAHFLYSINDVSTEKRRQMIEDIDNSEKYKIKVGEKLIYIINRSDDHEKSSMLGNLFKAFLKNEITYSEFLIASQIIDRLTCIEIYDFLDGQFLDYKLRPKPIDIGEVNNYFNVGLFEILPLKIELLEKSGKAYGLNSSIGYQLDDTIIKVKMTDLAFSIYNILKK